MSYRKLIFTNTATGSPDVSIPVHATTELTQTYQPLYARTLHRTMDGSAVVRQQWSGKLSTEITGRGLVPPGLTQIDYDQPVTIACIGHRSVRSSSNVVTIPANRRTDITVTAVTGATATGKSWYARAWDDDVYARATGTATGNVVTITLASGESHESYEIVYFPKLTCIMDPPSETFTQNDGWSWTIKAEEV